MAASCLSCCANCWPRESGRVRSAASAEPCPAQSRRAICCGGFGLLCVSTTTTVLGPPRLLVAGAGIGGLALALAAARAGWQVQVCERAEQLGEVGAGVQLGPNATRVLQALGVWKALQPFTTVPQRVRVRHGGGGHSLAVLPLAEAATARWGSPYVSVHRADLHRVLLQTAQSHPMVQIETDAAVLDWMGGETGVVQKAGVAVRTTAGTLTGDALVLADGVASSLRLRALPAEPAPVATGHVAFRAVLPMAALPDGLERDGVTAWLAPRMHVVHYPIRGGDFLNIAAFVEVPVTDRERWPLHASSWDDAPTEALALREAVAPLCQPLQALVAAVPRWAQWPLRARPPVSSALQLAPEGIGPVALLGDAAHPMLPYLAQGAAMALEDAAELGRQLGQVTQHSRAVARERWQAVPLALQAYAQARAARVGRVQAASWRNGRIFHAAGLVAWGRDTALRWAGPRLMANDWLYGA